MPEKDLLTKVLTYLLDCSPWSLQLIRLKQSARHERVYTCREIRFTEKNNLVKNIEQTKKHSNDKRHHKKDIFWHSNLWIIIAGIIAVISFIRIFDIHGIPSLPKNRKPIEVSDYLNMSANDAMKHLDFDDYAEGMETEYYFREIEGSYFECDIKYFSNEVPSCWNMYIRDKDYSLYGITVDKTTIEKANSILNREQWNINNTKNNYFNDPTINTVEYVPDFELSKIIGLKIEKGIIKEIQIHYSSGEISFLTQNIKYPESGQTSLPKETPDYFTLYSGKGYRPTEIMLSKNGFFTGSFSVRDDDEKEEYYCDFSGQFTDIKRVNEYTWSMKLKDFNLFSKIGEESQGEDGYILIGANPYGFDDDGLEYLLYMPQAPVTELTEDLFGWVYPFCSIDYKVLKCAVLYDVTGEGHYGFVGFPDSY